MKDINALLTQARGIKISNPDGTISFKIVDIQPGSIYSYLGIQDGDVISQINGEPIQELNEVMKLFGNMANLSKLNLGLGRGGETVTQNYNID
jgi:type II secretory pathway component PulC